jgi:hypothetical protein
MPSLLQAQAERLRAELERAHSEIALLAQRASESSVLLRDFEASLPLSMAEPHSVDSA